MGKFNGWQIRHDPGRFQTLVCKPQVEGEYGGVGDSADLATILDLASDAFQTYHPYGFELLRVALPYPAVGKDGFDIVGVVVWAEGGGPYPSREQQIEWRQFAARVQSRLTSAGVTVTAIDGDADDDGELGLAEGLFDGIRERLMVAYGADIQI